MRRFKCNITTNILHFVIISIRPQLELIIEVFLHELFDLLLHPLIYDEIFGDFHECCVVDSEGEGCNFLI